MLAPSRVAYLEMLINVEYPWIFLNWVSTHNVCVCLFTQEKKRIAKGIYWSWKTYTSGRSRWIITGDFGEQLLLCDWLSWGAVPGNVNPLGFLDFFPSGHWCVFVRFKKKNNDLFTQKIWSTWVVWPSSRVNMICLGRGFAKTHPRVFFLRIVIEGIRRNPMNLHYISHCYTV